MNPELFIHYGTQIRNKSKRVYRKSLKAIAVSKRGVIASTNTTIHYAKEIRLQAKNFKNNINQINRFDYEQNNLYKEHLR